MMQLIISILSILSIITSFIAIFLILTRDTDVANIVSHYREQIDNLKEETTYAIYEIQKSSKKQIKTSSNDIVEKLKPISEVYNDTIENNLKLITEQTKTISQLNDEIRKRDAIIERKIKQIKRLKNDI
jgi:hypothetical protein